MRKAFQCTAAILWCILTTGAAGAQSYNGSIDGQVLTADGMAALEYVSIAIYQSTDQPWWVAPSASLTAAL